MQKRQAMKQMGLMKRMRPKLNENNPFFSFLLVIPLKHLKQRKRRKEKQKKRKKKRKTKEKEKKIKKKRKNQKNGDVAF